MEYDKLLLCRFEVISIAIGIVPGSIEGLEFWG